MQFTILIQDILQLLSSTGFKVAGNNNEMFLDDDGQGNVKSLLSSKWYKNYS